MSDLELIKEEVKRRCLVPDVLSRAGIRMVNSVHFSSPFRADEHPSCGYDKRNNTWKDFTTDEGGDVIKLFQLLHNMSFMEALKELAASIGINIQVNAGEGFVSAPVNNRKKEFGELLDQNFIAALDEEEKEKYFIRLGMAFTHANNDQIEIDSAEHKEIMNTLNIIKADMQKGRIQKNIAVYSELFDYCFLKGLNNAGYHYLINKRKLTPEILKQFFVFVIDNYYEANAHLKKAFTEKELKQSGIVSDKGNLIFAKHRIIIPYLHNNWIVYIRGRYFDENNSTESKDGLKYLGLRNDAVGVNTPKRFFNSDILKTMLPGEELYMTEGEFDAIALTQLGYNSIAIPGTGNIPNIRQFYQLKKYKILLCMDNDTAGNGLKSKLVAIFRSMEKEIYEKKLTSKDINDFIAA